MTHGKNKKNFKLYSPLEFIAAVTQHIPEMSFQLVRYYGWYSNRMRGDRRKEAGIQVGTQQGVVHEKEIEVIDIRGYRPKRIPSLVWRECTPRAFLSGHIKNEESRSSLT